MHDGMHDKISIIDLGSQVTQLIARRVREDRRLLRDLPFNGAGRFRGRARKASSCPADRPRCSRQGAPRAPARVFKLGVPVLGICYGEQAMCAQLGGRSRPADHREFGRAYVEVIERLPRCSTASGRGRARPVWMSHGDRVPRCRPASRGRQSPTARRSPRSPTSGAASTARSSIPRWCTRPRRRAARAISSADRRLPGDWTMAGLPRRGIARIRAAGRPRPGDLRALGRGRFLGRGGTDPRGDRRPAHLRVRRSRPAAARRSREGGEPVPRPLQHSAGPSSMRRSCSSARSRASADPEAKRKMIGRVFIDVFEAEATKLGGAEFLAQGTLYPDVIESVSFTGGPSVTIKSHHNVGGLPERMNMKLVEPLRELFKDEVRALGRELGLPEASSAAIRSRAWSRHPLPGRDHPREARHPAPGGRDLHRGDPPRRPLRRRSGRPSRCCCRCGPWA